MSKPLCPPWPLGLVGPSGSRRTCSYCVSHHGRAGDWAKVLSWVHGLRPVRATVVVAAVLAKERADALGTKVSHAIVAIPRQNDRVGEDNFVLVDAALEIAQNELPA